MLLECIFYDVQVQSRIYVAEEDLAEVVSFADDDGIFVAQIAE